MQSLRQRQILRGCIHKRRLFQYVVVRNEHKQKYVSRSNCSLGVLVCQQEWLLMLSASGVFELVNGSSLVEEGINKLLDRV